MLFPYPSFINRSELNLSQNLYNNVRLTLRSNVNDIWYSIVYGTKIRTLLEAGINSLVVAEVQQEIENSLMKYFEDDIKLVSLDVWQESTVIRVALVYVELRTGKYNTVDTEISFVNQEVNQNNLTTGGVNTI